MCTCDRALELINEKIDQCISQENEVVLRSHLSECDECRGVYEAYSLIQQDLLALEEEPPENFAGQVMFRVMSEQQKKKKRKVPFGIIGTAACAAALALVIGFTDVGNFLAPKMKSEAMMNGSTSMNTDSKAERSMEYSLTDEAAEAEAPMSASDEDTGYDGADPAEYADDYADDVVVDDSEQLETDKGAPAWPELTSYTILLVYDSVDALGSYAEELEFFYDRPEGAYAIVGIDLAQEIAAACPDALRYETNQQALAACQDECIILIQE